MDSKKFLGLFIPRASFYLWIILLLVGIIAVLEWRIAIPGFLLLCFLTYYNISSNTRRKVEISSYIENLNFNIDTATKDTLLNFPMPLMVTEQNGAIIWYNASFKKISKQDNVNEKIIKSLVDEINTEYIRSNGFKDNTVSISKQITLNGMHYSVLCNFVGHDKKSDDKNHILILYFMDITEFAELKKKYADEKIMTGIIVIDNYDELMQSMEDSSRPQMLAEIEKKVNQWMSYTNGIIKKYERDKYLFLFESKYMKELEEKKFEILDTIKDINIGNKIPVTLSLGFGLNGKTPSENIHFSAAAIDVALGRGGDQVVVKNGDSFSFFGGKTRELEKRTKVKARVIAYALRELIDQASAAIIMGHENADNDSLGAALGLYRVV